jgi:hypothetical protein
MRKQIRNEFIDGLVICLAIMLALVFSGCTAGQFQGNPIPDTPIGKYVTARKFYNDQLESLTVYGALLTAEDKADMKKNLDPIFDSIETTLDGWKIALMDPAKDPTAYNNAWLKLRQKMVVTIAKYLD